LGGTFTAIYGDEHMKKTTFAILIVLTPTLVLAANEPLFRKRGMAMDLGGQAFSMTLEEVDRLEKSSVVEVTGAPAKSDAASAFILDGMCGLAKARGQRYFQARQIATQPLTFEISFPATGQSVASIPTDAIAPNVFAVSFCPVWKELVH
jgi:hypothetical protein